MAHTPIRVPASDIIDVARVLSHLENEGVTGAYVEVVAGRMEIKADSCSFGARTWFVSDDR